MVLHAAAAQSLDTTPHLQQAMQQRSHKDQPLPLLPTPAAVAR
jgi:hypothetical protein